MMYFVNKAKRNVVDTCGTNKAATTGQNTQQKESYSQNSNITLAKTNKIKCKQTGKKNHSQGTLFSIHNTTTDTQHNNANAPQQPKQRVRPHPNTGPFFINVFDENSHPLGH